MRAKSSMGVLMDNYPHLNTLLNKSARISASSSLEERLMAWSKPPSATEIEKCERAERMIKEAIQDDPILSKMNIKVFAKGSYANRTNIPSDSDVDVAVVKQNLFYNTYPENKENSDFGFVTAAYTFEQFSKDVAKAIENKFGKTEVIVDVKCIKVRSNSCRVDADVVPHTVHRRYEESGNYIEGVAINASGNIIYNWPLQDYENGVEKNTETNKVYKALVRILKSIRSEMEEQEIDSSKYAKSYLLACLAWNVPNSILDQDTYNEIVFDSLDYLIDMTSDYSKVHEWGEVNELKYLFRDIQPWKISEVNLFLREAKKFLGSY